ncbi:MAG: hypothetical protein KDE51_11140 [Anaerolineales bacterium]|nr:hypothetical protein [Anaerolineales bacterium]
MLKKKQIVGLLLVVCSGLLACVSTREVEPTAVAPTAVLPAATPTATLDPMVVSYVATVDAQRSPDVPPLPFEDNPDPLQCGIPVTWTADAPAWLNGVYEDELVRPIVFLYDSHLRLNIKAQAPHGSEVKVLLFQQNPVTNYYLVKIVGADPPNEGWVPAPFLSFEPLEDLVK